MDTELLVKIQDLLLEKRVAAVIAGINFLGTIFGFYYYAGQLQSTTLRYWIFVPDSPLATLAIGLSLLLFVYKKNYELLNAYAFVANFKYGLWTVFVLMYYFEGFWAINSTSMYVFLLFSHFMMFVQAFMVLSYSNFNWRPFSLVAAWFILNDFMDYFLDLHPVLPVEHFHPVNAAMFSAFLLTFLSLSSYLLLQSSLWVRLRQILLLRRHD